MALFDRGVELCPHGRPLGLDLAMPAGAALGLDLLAGPAMGSGRPPWTRALLAAIERHLAPGATVADVGTGSGILGLYALRLGATRVDAVDLDPLAAAVARRNARRNGLADRFEARAGSTEALGEGYDVAIVSLGSVADLAAVLLDTARRLNPGGTLVASPAEGAAERDRLHAWLRKTGLSPVDEIEREGWFVPVARAPGVSSDPQ